MKVLLVRFSSFGDVLQTLSVAGRLAEVFPGVEIHWVTRAEFASLIEGHPHVRKVWSLRRGAGLLDLWRLATQLRGERFTHIYDAHNNLRSRLLGWRLNGFLGWRVWCGRHRFLRRSIHRWKRFLLFRFRRNLFPKPFSGQFALLEPLGAWGVTPVAPAVPQLFLRREPVELARRKLPQGFSPFVALAPSAAFALKRWPLEHWLKLIDLMPQTRFAVLGGPEDSFLADLVAAAPERVINLAGLLSLEESAGVVTLSSVLVANDTGLMHVAEQTGVACVALMGPAPFGFPSRPRTRILELELPCRPCSKHGQGPCVNPRFQLCLRGIPPEVVATAVKGLLHA